MHFDENGFAFYSGLVVTFDTDDEGVFTQQKESWITVGTGLSRNSYLEDPLVNQIPAGSVAVRKKSFDVANNEFPWEYKVDYRGQKVYSKIDGSMTLVSSIFFKMDSYTTLSRPDKYYTWSENQKTWILSTKNAEKRRVDQNLLKKNQEITFANQRIYDLNEATDPDLWGTDVDPLKVALLKEWRKYAVLVKAIDPAALTITWPTRPTE